MVDVKSRRGERRRKESPVTQEEEQECDREMTILFWINGPILEVMQYEADPWTGLSKLIAPVR